MTTEILDRLDRIEASLSELKQDKRDTFDLPGAADYLGISRSTLYHLTCKSRIPHYKPAGKKLYFDKADLEGFIRRNRVGGE